MTDVLLQIYQHAHQTRVAVIGALEGPAARDAHHHLRAMIDSTTPPQVVIDLRCCTGIDTHGILSLIATHQAVTNRGCTLTLTAIPPLIQYWLEQEPRARHQLQTDSWSHPHQHPTSTVVRASFRRPAKATATLRRQAHRWE